MASTTFAAFAVVCAAIIAIELFSVLKQQPVSGTSTSTQAPSLDSAILLPLAAMMALFAAVELIYCHLPHTAAGAGNLRLSELVTVVMCAAVGLLELFFFVQPAGVVDLSMAAVEALPAAATVTFFLGMTLIIVHIRAGGEGGYCNPPVPAPEEMLKKMALGAAAALVSLMAIALYAKSELEQMAGRLRATVLIVWMS